MKAREQRHRVSIKARMRDDDGWSDVRIQNVSAHGMLLWTDKPPRPGCILEVRKSTITIVARAVWADDQTFGVRTQDAIDLQELLAEAKRPPGARPQASGDRRAAPRAPALSPAQIAERSRRRSSAAQFIIVVLVAAFAAVAITQGVRATFSKPMHLIEAALGGAPQSG